MKYIIIPKEKYFSIGIEILKEKGLESPRLSEDGTEVILHVENYLSLFPKETDIPIIKTRMVNIGEYNPIEDFFPYPVYNNPSSEFDELLSSPKWNIDNNK